MSKIVLLNKIPNLELNDSIIIESGEYNTDEDELIFSFNQTSEQTYDFICGKKKYTIHGVILLQKDICEHPLFYQPDLNYLMIMGANFPEWLENGCPNPNNPSKEGMH
jgi:hypothetical protein